MSDDIGEMRKELGEKAAISGEPMHQGASNEFKQAYKRKSLGFGSNTMPKKFGKGTIEPKTWTCVCGHVNKTNIVRKVGGIIVCWKCGVDKEYSEEKNE